MCVTSLYNNQLYKLHLYIRQKLIQHILYKNIFLIEHIQYIKYENRDNDKKSNVCELMCCMYNNRLLEINKSTCSTGICTTEREFKQKQKIERILNAIIPKNNGKYQNKKFEKTK